MKSNFEKRPAPITGLRHVALFVDDLEGCLDFYTRLVGMVVEWNPDPDNYYITSGNDNFALHRYTGTTAMDGPQRLDHIGFIMKRAEDVDAWHQFLAHEGVRIKTSPRLHRDGARSFYCFDPDGNTVQFIYHPPIS